MTDDHEPEEFEWVTNYAAQEFRHVGDVARRYHAKGWATPISGDHTTIRERFLR